MTVGSGFVDPVLLTATRVLTFEQQRPLTNASGFFFERNERLYLITSRHVLWDEPSNHHPDRVEIELHVDSNNMAESINFSIPLYRDDKSVWRQARDSAGEVDVAAVQIDRDVLPPQAAFRAFTPEHLVGSADVEIGTSLLVVGFPLGFHDTLHHMPVVRQAIVASSFAFRFQGQGYFLTDARTHSGTSGAPVTMRGSPGDAGLGGLPWKLLGVHSASLDIGGRDSSADEALGLNCAWYADILLTLTEPTDS
jgi:hypothetical protein